MEPSKCAAVSFSCPNCIFPGSKWRWIAICHRSRINQSGQLRNIQRCFAAKSGRTIRHYTIASSIIDSYIFISFSTFQSLETRCRIIWNILSVWRSRISWSVLLVCLCFRDRKWSNTNFCLSKAEPSCDSHLTISSGNVARQGACLSWVGKAHKAYT